MGRKTKLTIQYFFAGVFVMLLVAFLFTSDYVFSTGDEETSQALSLENVSDGTYTGSGKGYGGPIEVEVTVTDGAISDINILDHSETAGVSDEAFEIIPDAIISENSTDVDSVSGATVSSEGIKAAVNDALSSGGNASEDGAESAALSGTLSETSYQDGTYQGEADGHNDLIKVEVTVTDGKISEVNILEHQETEGLVDEALVLVPEAIVQYNGTQVDTVSSATITSEAILSAVENALESAK